MYDYIPFTAAYKRKKLIKEVKEIIKICKEQHERIFTISLDYPEYLLSRISLKVNKYDIDFLYEFKVGYISFIYYGNFINLSYNTKNYKITNKELIDSIIIMIQLIKTDYDLILSIKKGREKSQRKEEEKKEPKKQDKNSNHPKWSIYQTLVQTVMSRKEQLSKMSKNDKNYQTLTNELKTAENKMLLFKQKYGF
jgi:hypothetical protein